MDGLDHTHRDLLRLHRGAAHHLHDPRDQIPRDPRVGSLRIETTRGDRLFITLLGSAFINIAWLGIVGDHQPYAMLVCLAYASAVFRWV